MVTILCKNCGKVFKSFPSAKRKFCSQRCRNLFRSDDISKEKRRWPINWDFFERWTPALAYWVGLMLTDGTISASRKRAHPIAFTSKDKSLVEFIRDRVTPDKPLYCINHQNGNQYWMWQARSIKFLDRLSRFGIVPRKSKIVQLPQMPSRFQWDLIRGILDGDGSVTKSGQILFATGSKIFAQQLSRLFLNNSLKPHQYKYRGRDAYVIFLGQADSIQLAQRLYQDNPFCLERKRVKMGI